MPLAMTRFHWQLEMAQGLAARWFNSAGGTIEIMSDVEFNAWRARSNQGRRSESNGPRDGAPAEDYNLIVLGGPGRNPLAAELIRRIPLRAGPDPGAGGDSFYSLGPCRFDAGPGPGDGHAVVTIGPWGLGRLFALVSLSLSSVRLSLSFSIFKTSIYYLECLISEKLDSLLYSKF